MVLNYKCPGCGASMVYDARKKCLVCDYCNTQVSVDQLSGEEKEQLEEELQADSFSQASAEENTAEEAVDDDGREEFRACHCPNCGAQMLTEENTAAAFCAFCGSPVIFEKELTGEKRPAGIIPFRIQKEEAADRFVKWTKKGLFTPSSFNRSYTMEKITGIYVPFWLYDYQVNAWYSAHGTRVRHEVRGDYRYTHTDHFRIQRELEAQFDKIPADASKKMPDDVMDSLEPFHYEELKEFQMPYLSGFLADRYDYTGAEMRSRVESRVQKYTEEEARRTMTGYATVNITYRDVRPRNTRMMYVMFPVWTIRYTYIGKQYTFTMNGQTGKLIGTLPISWGKAAAWFAGMTAAFTALLTMIQLL